LLASLNFLGAYISIASFANATTRGEGDGEKKNIGEALQDIKPLDTLSSL
jgi:hypothetical protein